MSVGLPPLSTLTASGSPLDMPPGSVSQGALSLGESLRAPRLGVVIEGAVYWAGYRDVNNVNNVVHRRITGFLCVAEELSLPTFVSPEDIETETVRFEKIPMRDDARTALKAHFEKAFRFIDSCRVAGKPVVVYCKKGQSRSASIAAAYLMREYNIHFVLALELLRKSRKADPNFAFCQQLHSLGDEPAQAMLDTAPPAPLEFSRSAVSERLFGGTRSGVVARGVPSYFALATEMPVESPTVTGDQRRDVEFSSMIRPFHGLGSHDENASARHDEGNPLSTNPLTSRPTLERHFGFLDASVMTNPESFADAENSRRDSRPFLADPLTFMSVPQELDEDDEADPTIDEDTVHQLLAQSGVVDQLGALTIDTEAID